MLLGSYLAFGVNMFKVHGFNRGTVCCHHRTDSRTWLGPRSGLGLRPGLVPGVGPALGLGVTEYALQFKEGMVV